MEMTKRQTILRFAKLFILSTLIVALAWMLLESEILGTVRNWTHDLLYATLIGICIAMAQIVLDPRPQPAGAPNKTVDQSAVLFEASPRFKGKTGKSKAKVGAKRAAKKKGRR